MLLQLIDHLVWSDWNRTHRRRKWPTQRLAPALIIYDRDWAKISKRLFADLPRKDAVIALKTILKYARER